jgi:hypothetical protein
MELKRLKAVDLAKRQVQKLELDLNGLTVLTECASNAYGLTSVMALMAGARVLALGRDSSYGTFEKNREEIITIIERENLPLDKIEFYKNTAPSEIWKAANIITNSGFIRPFTAEKIASMNSKAVIPLMWETWELRENELDIAACQKNGIPVIGTNEHFEKADMFGYPGMLAIKLLLESGNEIINNKIVLLGGGLTGRLIAKTFKDLRLDFTWFTSSGKEKEIVNYAYSELGKILSMDDVDVILCAEHSSKAELIGKNSAVHFSQIKDRFPNVQWCHLTGDINNEELEKSGISYYPKTIKKAGYMSYDTDNLGWGPVVILNSAGLKVGEIAARSRLNNESIETTIRRTVEYGIGQDFEGGFMNFKVHHEVK